MLCALTFARCRPCPGLMPKLLEAAPALLKNGAAPGALRVFSIDVGDNDIAHLLPDISLRQQPWQYTLPLLYVAADRQSVEQVPWRGSMSALEIEAGRLTTFLQGKTGASVGVGASAEESEAGGQEPVEEGSDNEEVQQKSQADTADGDAGSAETVASESAAEHAEL